MSIQDPTAEKSKWQVKREASYETLVQSAMRQFHDRGYAVTRVEDIVAGTGYTSGAFYFHFKNKADCFWHAIEYRQQRRGDWSRITDGLDPATTPLPELLHRLFGRFDAAVEGRFNWALVMVEFRNQHRDEPATLERLRTVYAVWHADIARFVVALQNGGWISADRDVDQVTTQLFAATEGVRTHAAVYSLESAAVESALVDLLTRILE